MTLNYHTAKFLRNSALAPVWAWAFSLTLAFSSKTWGEKYWEELLEGWYVFSLPSPTRTPHTTTGRAPSACRRMLAGPGPLIVISCTGIGAADSRTRPCPPARAQFPDMS